MAGPPPTRIETAREELFDRYLLPKVALTIILAASLLGTWVSIALGGGTSSGAVDLLPLGGAAAGELSAVVALVLAKWIYFVALGVLAGGLLWKHAFVRPADVGAVSDSSSAAQSDATRGTAGEYCEAMYRRFDRIALGAVLLAAIGGAVTVATYVETLGWSPLVLVHAALFAGLLVVASAESIGERPVDAQFRSATALAALALALGLTATTATAEVALRGIDAAAVAVRVLHLLAFAVWIGGAVWNIFVAVPTGQRRPTTGVVRAAGEQLERFRWAVRLIIPTILLTGAYQGVAALGWSVAPYFGSALGLAVLAKLGAIGVLVGIFKLCPMWRACSPVEGVCELEDLAGTESADRAAGGPADEPTGVSADGTIGSARAGATAATGEERPEAAADGGVAEVTDDA